MVSPRGAAASVTTSCTPPALGCSTYARNARGQVTLSKDPLNRSTTTHYDPDGNMDSVIDANNHQTTFVYDAANQQTQTQRADSPQTSLVTDYNPDGTVADTKDGAGATTTYTYDALGRVATSKTPPTATVPAGNTTTYGYDPAGNTVTKADPGGSCPAFSTVTWPPSLSPSDKCTAFKYDAADQLLSIKYSDGTTPNVTNITYDLDGQRTAATDGTGSRSWTWDSLHRLTSSTDGASKTVTYGYADSSKSGGQELAFGPTNLTYPTATALVVNRHYDPLGRIDCLLTATSVGTCTPGASAAGQSNFTYTADSAPAITTTPTTGTAVVDTTSYDNADQLSGITSAQGATTLSSFAYNRDSVGQLTQTTSTGVPADNHYYGYTPLNQLNAQGTAASPTPNLTYDSADNLTQQIRQIDGSGANLATSTQAFDTANELTSSTTASSPAPTVDTTVSTDQTSQGNTVISPSFTTAGTNELIVALVSTDGPVPGPQTVSGVTGGGLTWTLASRANTNLGTSEVWQAWASAKLTSQTVTATLATGGYDATITVASFTGAAHALGASAHAGSGTGAPSVSLVTTQPNSLVWAAGNDWDAATTHTAASGQTIVHQKLDTARGDTYWSQKLNSAVTSPGTAVSISDTAPTNEQWNLAAVEIPSAQTGSSLTTNHTYDTRGNRTTSTPAGGSTTTLTYDQANRFTAYGSIATYAYNGDGLRTSKTVNSVTQNFVWDLSGGLPQLLMDGTTAYVYAPDGTPLEQISTPAAPAVDQVVSADATNLAANITSPAFTTAGPGELVVAFISADGPTSPAQTISSVTGGSLTWTLASRANGQHGTAEVWQAWATNKLTNATVTANLAQTNYISSITVATFTGADTTLGATATAGSSTGAPTVSLTTTRANSLVWGNGNDWDGATARTVGSGQSIVHQDIDSARGDTFWTQRLNSPLATSGSTTALSDSAPTTHRWNLAAAEIKAPASNVAWYHHDQLGSTRTLTDANGIVKANYNYDAYGRLSAASGSAIASLGFGGQYTDQESGFQYLRARYYDPSSGQFLSSDPVVTRTLLPYSYAKASPLTEKDPSGLDPNWRVSEIWDNARILGITRTEWRENTQLIDVFLSVLSVTHQNRYQCWEVEQKGTYFEGDHKTSATRIVTFVYEQGRDIASPGLGDAGPGGDASDTFTVTKTYGWHLDATIVRSEVLGPGVHCSSAGCLDEPEDGPVFSPRVGPVE